MTKTEYINIKFSEVLGIFDNQCLYPVLDNQKEHKRPMGKVKDIQGMPALVWRNFFFLDGIKLSFDIDDCMYLHIAIIAQKGTKKCLFLMVHDKEPRGHKNRFVMVGKSKFRDVGS